MTLSSALMQGARCADPKYLPVVDAAFARTGGPAQRQMEQQVCSVCPIWEACLAEALKHGEHGPWGGTNRKRRAA